MSGLESLGAVASVIGVIGVVKTSIDLLDIISSARSAERDLEDLLVHLQWQRIRFYCWVQETGFMEVMVQQEKASSALQGLDLMGLLPHELRLSFVLSHIKRSIENMNMRLKSANPVLQRYATAATSNCDTWKEKFSRGLDPGRECTLQGPSGHRTEVIRFSLLDKLRWVAGDRQELTGLVDELRKYNLELKEILPYYKIAPFERRVGIIVVTSRRLAAGMAATRSDCHSEEDEHFQQYQGAAQLLERSQKMEAVETLSPHSDDQPCAKVAPSTRRAEENNSNRPAVGSQSHRPTSSLVQLSLYRNMSEFKFAALGSTDSEAREFASYGTVPVIIEWRQYSTRTTPDSLSALDIRVHMLVMQLKQLLTQPDINILNCLGHFRDEAHHRYGIAFEYPKGGNTTTPITLRDRLLDDHKRRIRRDLDDRFRAAQALITAVYRLFSVNWLHKNLSSNNVLFFEDNAGSRCLESPYVCGFDLARRDAHLEMSEKFPSVCHDTYTATEQRLYWHPDRNSQFDKQYAGRATGAPTAALPRYRREYDTYSLGILLLEIGLWCPIQRILKDCKTDDFRMFTAEVKGRYLLELRGRMGRVYTDIVSRCLEGDFGERHTVNADENKCNTSIDDDARSRRFLEDFERYAVSVIEKPLGFAL